MGDSLIMNSEFIFCGVPSMTLAAAGENLFQYLVSVDSKFFGVIGRR